MRVIVALTEQGVADIDERSRVIELGELFGTPIDEAQKEFGADIVVLDSPDASPPIGTVGLCRGGGRTLPLSPCCATAAACSSARTATCTAPTCPRSAGTATSSH